MLALTRKKGESLVINNDIEITILEIRGDQIKLGVSAPKEVPIYRKEVYTQIQQENRKSRGSNMPNPIMKGYQLMGVHPMAFQGLFGK